MGGLHGVSITSFSSIDIGLVLYLFLEKYVPHTLYHCKKDKFLALEWGIISIAACEAKFHALSSYYYSFTWYGVKGFGCF